MIADLVMPHPDYKFRIRDRGQSEILQKILTKHGKAWSHGELYFGSGGPRSQIGIFVKGSGNRSLTSCSDELYFRDSASIEINTDEFILDFTEGTPEEVFPVTTLSEDDLYEIYSKNNNILDVANIAIKQHILYMRDNRVSR